MASAGPFDNFLESVELLKNSYAFFGALAGFPLSRTLFTLEFLYLFNQQTFLVANTAVHVFF
jgi:hypothetical protein